MSNPGSRCRYRSGLGSQVVPLSTGKRFIFMTSRLKPKSISLISIRREVMAGASPVPRLAAPLLREGVAHRGDCRFAGRRSDPSTEKQIALLKTFADQAVIAIENVRLFQELSESLEQQTATSEILGVIASSPTDLEPVFNTILANAVHLCEAQNGALFRFDGEMIHWAVGHGIAPEVEAYFAAHPLRPSRESAVRRVALELRLVHVADVLADPEFTAYRTEPYRQQGMRSVLALPLLKENDLIGIIVIHRKAVRPFTEKQIELVTTFANQAVIAIENVRLFQELDARTSELARSVGELKALGEVGQAVSSTLDLQTVLSAIVGHAVQLSGTGGGVIYEYDEAAQEFHLGPVTAWKRRSFRRFKRPRSVRDKARRGKWRPCARRFR